MEKCSREIQMSGGREIMLIIYLRGSSFPNRKNFLMEVYLVDKAA
jgi:hypothetical protein